MILIESAGGNERGRRKLKISLEQENGWKWQSSLSIDDE